MNCTLNTNQTLLNTECIVQCTKHIKCLKHKLLHNRKTSLEKNVAVNIWKSTSLYYTLNTNVVPAGGFRDR